jgi:hypothetical protein
MARIDLGSEDSKDDLTEALRQLERQQKKAPEPATSVPEDTEAAKRRAQREREAEHRRSREDIEGAVEAIRERQVAVERAAPKAKRGPALWIALGIVAAVLIGAGVLFLKPEPLPPPAASPQEAVRGFWDEIVGSRYQGATVYYPGLVDKYGSRKQAAVHLEQTFRDDPPTRVGAIGEPEELPDTADLRVSYEVWRRSGRPRTGEFIIRKSTGEEGGYVIIIGP